MPVLTDALTIGSATVRNRLYRAPVLEGAGDGPDAATVYARQFAENARHGTGLIIQGSSCVLPEGRTSPSMTLVHTRERVQALAPVVEAVHEHGAAIFLQLGHGGIFAMEAWHEPYASRRQGPLLAASPVPWFLRPLYRAVPVEVLDTDAVFALAEQFGRVAGWARDAGYDGVQLGSANAKLLDQFLSPFFNRRRDEFGGSLEGRARILAVIRDAVARHAGADYSCTVKIPVETSPPGTKRTSFDEALDLCALAEQFGYHAITPVRVSVFPDTTLSRGGVPSSLWQQPAMRKRLRAAAPRATRRVAIVAGAWLGAQRARFEPVWNRDLFMAAKRRVRIPVFAVGGIRTVAEAREIIESGQADMVGIGRPFYAEPDLARRMLAADATQRRCVNSNMCVAAQMLGMKGACYNPEVTRRAPRSTPAPPPR